MAVIGLYRKRYDISWYNTLWEDDLWKGKKVIISNKIKCKKCWDVIESTYRHDLKFCKCCAVAVDVGKVINFQTDVTSRYIK